MAFRIRAASIAVVGVILSACATRENRPPSGSYVQDGERESMCDFESLLEADDPVRHFWSFCTPEEQVELYFTLAVPRSSHSVLPVEIARASPCSMMPLLQQRMAFESDGEKTQALLIWADIARRTSACSVDRDAMRALASRFEAAGADRQSQINAIIAGCILDAVDCGPVLERARKQREKTERSHQ